MSYSSFEEIFRYEKMTEIYVIREQYRKSVENCMPA